MPCAMRDPLTDRKVFREVRKGLNLRKGKELEADLRLFWMPYQIITYKDYLGRVRRMCIDLHYYDALAPSHRLLLLIKNSYLKFKAVEGKVGDGTLVKAEVKDSYRVIYDIVSLFERIKEGVREYSSLLISYAHKLGRVDLARTLFIPTGFKSLKELKAMEEAGRERGELILIKAIIEGGLNLGKPPLGVSRELKVFYFPKVLAKYGGKVAFVEVGGKNPSLDKVFTSLYSEDESFKLLTDELFSMV